ncbi:MAG: hypothetical protein JWM96_1155 [Alphaproteobacteria bacterium]|nr:hypothetical protein [Alphaproteobacteria bacterium]
MKSLSLSLYSLAAFTLLCQPAVAARQTAVGGGITVIDASGITEGVDMSASGGTGTLSVGVINGPRTDILSNNNPYVTGPVAVSTDASSTASIVFNSSSNVYGDIGVTQPGGPFFLGISAGNDNSEVNFLGSVYSTTLDVLGTGVVNFNSGFTNVTATNFAGDGIISLAPNTTLIGALTSTAGANTGTLLMGGNSVLNGAAGGASGLRAINVIGGNNLTGVSSTVTGAVDAFSFSLGTNTLNIGGALTIANTGPGGVINTTLASPTLYGNIRPVGATNLGATLGINVLVPSTAYIPVGTQFNIVQTQAGTTQSGTNGSLLAITVQNPTNPLYTFSAVPLAGTQNGLVAIRAERVPFQAANSPVVGALLNAPASPDLIAVLTAINAMSDPVAVGSAVSQLSPSTPGIAAPLVAFQTTRQFQNLWMSRLETVQCSYARKSKQAAGCKGPEQVNGWWAKGFGEFGDQDARTNFTAYDSKTVGAMVGFDAPIARTMHSKTRAGLGLGYAKSTIDGKTFDNNTDFDTYQATAYIGHERGLWFAQGNASLGLNDYSGTRHIAFPGIDRTAESDYSGQNYTVFANTGYHLPVKGLTVTPLASLQYTRLNIGDYTESGAGNINLDVESQHYNFVESGLGTEVARDFFYKDVVISPEVHAKWLHQLDNPGFQNTAAFTVPGSQSFNTTEMTPDRNTYNVGAGVDLLSCACTADTWSVEAAYDYNWRNDGYQAHQGMVKLSTRF